MRAAAVDMGLGRTSLMQQDELTPRRIYLFSLFETTYALYCQPLENAENLSL
jgi:hypothetical protein